MASGYWEVRYCIGPDQKDCPDSDSGCPNCVHNVVAFDGNDLAGKQAFIQRLNEAVLLNVHDISTTYVRFGETRS